MTQSVEQRPAKHSPWAKVVDPKPAYVFGRAGMAFTSGFYISAYAIFLWDYLGGNQAENRSLRAILPAFGVLLLIAIKHLIEFGLDAISSLISDLWVYSSRRQMFLLGMTLHLLSFILLLVLSLQVPSLALEPKHVLLVAGYVVAVELFRAGGDALISNTFDSWAVSAVREAEQPYTTAELFAAGRVANRLFLFIGAGFSLFMFLSLYLGISGGPLPSGEGSARLLQIRSYFWTGLWGMAATSQAVVVLLMWQLSAPIYDVTGRDGKARQKENSPVRFRDVLREAFDLRSVPAWLLYMSIYTMGMILSYAWPVLLEPLVPRPGYYAVPLGFFLAGLLGSLIGRRLATSNSQTDVPMNRQSRIAAAGVSIEAALFLLLALVLLPSEQQGPSVAAATVILMLGTRVVDFIADPFVDALLHDRVFVEQIRSAVVSLRTALCNLAVSVCYAVAAGTSTVSRDARANVTRALAAAAAFGLLVGLGMLFIRRPRS